MTGDVCLQGGAELQPGCEPMDRAMLTAAAGAPRRVLVAPFAGRPGRERTVAGANAERWYRGLGALEVDVVTDEGDAFASALALAELLVLPAPVGVRHARPPAEPADAVQPGHQLDHGADPWQVGQLGGRLHPFVARSRVALIRVRVCPCRTR